MGGGRDGRQGPGRLWHDCWAPGCHFVTVAVVAVGGGTQTLAPSPRRPRTWRQQGEPVPGTPPPVVLWAPMPVPSLCQLPEALLERRGGRGSVG